MGLQISEIEGDAILFYKFGEPPSLREVYQQVEKMFCAFHQNLAAYDNRRYCQCKACTSAISLTLKVITHYGEFTQYKVSTFQKLIGKDLILAHQLLKNSIPQHEYWLVTSPLAGDNSPATIKSWMQWKSQSEPGENQQTYYFTPLTPLKENVSVQSPPPLHLGSKRKVISLSREYDTDIITLFHAAGDFNYRHHWQEGVKKVEEVNHFLPRVGMKCRCILDNGEQFIYSSSYYYKGDTIEFSETDELNNRIHYFVLEKTGPGKSRLTLSVYIGKGPIESLTFAIATKSKLTNDLEKSLLRLEEFVATLRVPTADPT
jgi:hypothetical protein